VGAGNAVRHRAVDGESVWLWRQRRTVLPGRKGHTVRCGQSAAARMARRLAKIVRRRFSPN